MKSIAKPVRVLNVMTISHFPRGGGPSVACCQIRVEVVKATVLAEVQVTKAENFPGLGPDWGH